MRKVILLICLLLCLSFSIPVYASTENFKHQIESMMSKVSELSYEMETLTTDLHNKNLNTVYYELTLNINETVDLYNSALSTMPTDTKEQIYYGYILKLITFLEIGERISRDAVYYTMIGDTQSANKCTYTMVEVVNISSGLLSGLKSVE